jgi:hypothetical protein
MDMVRFQLTASIGFTFDTSLAVSRMIYDGFFDRYRKLRIIAAHGGGALPYLISRMDQCFDNIPACREKISARPSEYVHRILADAVVFAPEVLDLCLKVFGADNVLVRVRLSAHDRRHAGVLKRVNGSPIRPATRCVAATRCGCSGCSSRVCLAWRGGRLASGLRRRDSCGCGYRRRRRPAAPRRPDASLPPRPRRILPMPAKGDCGFSR